MSIDQIIIDHLKAQEPCTLEELCNEVLQQIPGVTVETALLDTMRAIIRLTDAHQIEEWEQHKYTDPMKFTWQTSEIYP